MKNAKKKTLVSDWVAAGAGEGEIAFSCVGRRNPAFTDCDYAGGGLFRLNPIKVVMPDGGISETFDFYRGEK